MAIARAIVSDPTLLVCDEPTGDLDRATAARDPAAAADAQPRARQDGRDGHARPQGGRVRAPALHLDKGTLARQRAAGVGSESTCPLLWAGLFRKKTRTILTLLSVVVAFLLFGLLQAVRSRSSRAPTAPTPSACSPPRATRSSSRCRCRYLRRIEQVPGVVGRGPRRLVRRQVPEREQRLPGLRGGSRALPRHVPGVHHRARRSARPSPRRAPARSRASAWSIASAGRSARSCRSARRSTPRPTAA